MPGTITPNPTIDLAAYTMREEGATYATIARRLGWYYVDEPTGAVDVYTGAVYRAVQRHARRHGLTIPGSRTRRTRCATTNALGFGVEIECRRPTNMNRLSVSQAQQAVAAALQAAGIQAVAENYNHTTRRHWKVVYDNSSDLEIVSPILVGEEGLAEVKRVMAALREMGCTVGRSEGMHVHVDVRNLDADARERLVRYAHAAKAGLLDALVARNRRTCTWAPAFTRAGLDRAVAIARGEEPVRSRDGFRYHHLNVVPMIHQGSVEFRAHQGTLNGTKATSWVSLVTALVAAAQNDTLPEAQDLGALEALTGVGTLTAERAGYLRDRAVRLA